MMAMLNDCPSVVSDLQSLGFLANSSFLLFYMLRICYCLALFYGGVLGKLGDMFCLVL